MPPEKPESRRAGESLNEYIARLEAFQDTQLLRIHPDYISERGEILVKPVVTYGVDADGTPHPLVGTSGQQATALDEDHAVSTQSATVATQATLVPTAPNIYYLYGIWVTDTTANWADNRSFQPVLTDGSATWPLCTATTVSLGATGQAIWPTKEADNAKACLPPFPVSNAYYIEIVDAMAAAETADIDFTYVHRSSEL